MLLYNNMVFELWLDIKDFENKYQISSIGRVKNKISGRILKNKSNGGYHIIKLNVKKNLGKQFRINILVAKHFVFNSDPFRKVYVDHIDNNRLNNKMENLRWVTPSENCINYYKQKKYPINPILQYDKNMNLIREWNNLNELFKNNKKYDKSLMYKCLNGKLKYIYGFIWKYKNQKEKKEVKLEDDEIFKNCGIINGKDLSNYEISNYGKIKSLYTDKFLKSVKDGNGYININLKINIRGTTYKVHRLVAYLFVEGRTEDRKVVNHKDKDRSNNHYGNLEWVTDKENTQYSCAKKIKQIDIKTGEIINIFNSIGDACTYLEKERDGTYISSSNLSRCCKGRFKTMYGYKWQYV